jgi:hypothetical protein
MGDTDVGAIYGLNQPITGWILFVVFELLTVVLMMSLLVALIMKQYDRISRDAHLNNYQQRAKLIFENSYLTQLFRSCKCNASYELQRNLMIITDTSAVETASKDPIEEVQRVVKTLVRENEELRGLLKTQASETDRKVEAIIKALSK